MKYSDFQERTTRGTFGFPIQLYYVDRDHPQYEMPLHWHMECELILVLKGVFNLYVNGKSIKLNGGQSAFIPGGFIHGGIPENCVYECVVFQMETFLGSSAKCLDEYRNACENGQIRELIFERNSRNGKLADSIFELMETESPGYVFKTTGLLWQLTGNLIETCERSDIKINTNKIYKQNARIKRVLAKIRNDYSKPIKLEDLARIAGLNPQYLCKVFKQVTGKTPIDYLNYYRIECAGEMLCFEYMTVTETALQCGFGDLSYFNRLFKRQKHMSPTEYRKKHAGLWSKQPERKE